MEWEKQQDVATLRLVFMVDVRQPIDAWINKSGTTPLAGLQWQFQGRSPSIRLAKEFVVRVYVRSTELSDYVPPDHILTMDTLFFEKF